jgi:uncharacterized protein (DUF4415 family)
MKRGKIARYTSEELAAMRRVGQSQTDWARVVAMRDDDIVFDEDSPELDEACFAQTVRHVPVPKARVTLRLDQDVVTWFKAQGKGYQKRINAILRAYMETQQARGQ